MKTFTMIVTASLLSLSLQGCVILSNAPDKPESMPLAEADSMVAESTANPDSVSAELMVGFLRDVFVPIFKVLAEKG